MACGAIAAPTSGATNASDAKTRPKLAATATLSAASAADGRMLRRMSIVGSPGSRPRGTGSRLRRPRGTKRSAGAAQPRGQGRSWSRCRNRSSPPPRSPRRARRGVRARAPSRRRAARRSRPRARPASSAARRERRRGGRVRRVRSSPAARGPHAARPGSIPSDTAPVLVSSSTGRRSRRRQLSTDAAASIAVSNDIPSNDDGRTSSTTETRGNHGASSCRTTSRPVRAVVRQCTRRSSSPTS